MLVGEHELGQALGQLGLAHARRAQEEERTDRLGRIVQAGPRATHRVGHRLQRLVLTDDTAAQGVFHLQQLLALALQHLLDRHPGPAADHGGDLLGVDHFRRQGLLRADTALAGLGFRQATLQGRDLAILQLAGAREVTGPLSRRQVGAQAVQGLAGLGGAADLVLLGLPARGHLVAAELQVIDLDFEVFQPLPRGRVGFLGQGLALDLQLHQAAVDFVELLGLGVDRHPHPAGGLVHQVDGLVGQEAVGDVAVAERGGGDEGAIGDPHPVVHLVLLLQAAQDRDGVLHRGLADEHRLEPAGQGRVLLDVLAVLIQRGGADAVQLAARQSGFQQVGGVHRPVALAGPDQGVHLVDEQDDRALGGRDLAEHGLQALLELAAIFRAGDQAAHVERQQLLVLQAFGHVALDDALGQTLDDGGLADPGLADQDGVVLGAARQDLDGAANLLIAADHRVDLAVARGLGQVAGIALEGVIAVLGRGAVGGAALANGGGGGFQALGGGPGVLQDLGRVAAFLGDGDQQALGGDEGVAGLLGAALGGLEDARGVGLHVELAAGPIDARRLGQQGVGRRVGGVGPAAGALDQGAAEPVLLLEQDLEQMFGPQLLVPLGQGQALGRLDRGLGAVGIEIDLHAVSPSKADAGRSPLLSTNDLRGSFRCGRYATQGP